MFQCHNRAVLKSSLTLSLEMTEKMTIMYQNVFLMLHFELLSIGFIFFQASLLKNDETKALTPASLQKELNNLLKFNPDFAEAVSVFFFIQNGFKGISSYL